MGSFSDSLAYKGPISLKTEQETRTGKYTAPRRVSKDVRKDGDTWIQVDNNQSAA